MLLSSMAPALGLVGEDLPALPSPQSWGQPSVPSPTKGCAPRVSAGKGWDGTSITLQDPGDTGMGPFSLQPMPLSGFSLALQPVRWQGLP